MSAPQVRGAQAINAPQSEGLVGYEWEADWRYRCGSALGKVNAADHLWQVGPEPGDFNAPY
jgi:hypothetical protein